MRTLLIGIAVLLLATVTLAWLNREAVTYFLMAQFMSPPATFDESPEPPTPDYRELFVWAAHPAREDLADFVPAGPDAAQADAPVAAFFIHPTTYFRGEHWNQPIGHEQAEWIVRERTLRHQASAFNACCDVYAPHYRQATIFSFVDRSGDGEKALDFAYQDVRRAFRRFLDNLPEDTPFIVAGHSQGAFHGDRLVREEIAGTDRQARMVAAYLIGFSVAQSPLEAAGLPVCTSATQTGCVVGWNAVEAGKGGLFDDVADVACVNPLNWRTDSTRAEHAANLGAIGFPQYQSAVDGEDLADVKVEPGVADAACRAGRLEVSEIRSVSFPARMPGTEASLHPYDYGLFYANLRQNAVERVAAYRSRSSANG